MCLLSKQIRSVFNRWYWDVDLKEIYNFHQLGKSWCYEEGMDEEMWSLIFLDIPVKHFFITVINVVGGE
jgi:hypothetical protein